MVLVAPSFVVDIVAAASFVVVASAPSSVVVAVVGDGRSSFAWLDYLLGASSSACLEQELPLRSGRRDFLV